MPLQSCSRVSQVATPSPLQEGLVFGIINLVGNFGTVFVDQAYWQSAIAAKPSASHKGYILGARHSSACTTTCASSK